MELQIFQNNGFNIRGGLINNEPYFALVDICKALDISNPSMTIQQLDEDERAKLDLGRQGEAWAVTESGLYRIIMRSDKPQARPFQKWVTSEVLPSIRKTGSYSIQSQFQIPQTYSEALMLAAKQAEQIEQQTALIAAYVDEHIEDFAEIVK